jgi:hypothetical protein
VVVTFRALMHARRAVPQRKATDEALARAALGYRQPPQRITVAPRRRPGESTRAREERAS